MFQTTINEAIRIASDYATIGIPAEIGGVVMEVIRTKNRKKSSFLKKLGKAIPLGTIWSIIFFAIFCFLKAPYNIIAQQKEIIEKKDIAISTQTLATAEYQSRLRIKLLTDSKRREMKSALGDLLRRGGNFNTQKEYDDWDLEVGNYIEKNYDYIKRDQYVYAGKVGGIPGSLAFINKLIEDLDRNNP